MPAGRPTDFSEAIADAICERIANGESLRAICADDDMPAKSSVFKWLSLHETFADQYARAREAQADALFDDILNIADTPLVGQKTKATSDGKLETTEGDMIEHRRLQVDARKWMASKLQPKKYGDKTQLTGDAENPIVTVNKIELIALSSHDDSEG
ncbi:terminase small subunit protein [Pelagibacterium luteolum]|uniref:Phage terminase small subunit n=1 Tax=Pelagibacterium luteolum TaxID=440168 RepID=A0A1G7THR5_9HYPH|nr:terminase small subunit protein [Pelagibacterium luteolum]SDG34785.1 hypothetical protein SAMN04487974_102134 [Pelagibacterium luteolum]